MLKSIKPNVRRFCLTSTKSQHIEVTFALVRPEAQKVLVCGDFNRWSPASLRMIRRSQNGRWESISRWSPVVTKSSSSSTGNGVITLTPSRMC